MSSAETDTPEVTPEDQPKLALDVKVESPSSCQRHVTVTVAQADIDRYVSKAFKDLQPKAEVPGFRIGRAPRKLVEAKFKDQVRDQVKGELLMDSMTQVSEDQDFSAISEPDFDYDAVKMPDEGDMTFEFDIEVRPEFDMPAWQGLELERPTKDYTDDEVNDHLGTLLERYAEQETVDEKAEPGDFVVVDITCRHEGNVVSDLEAESIRLRPTLSFQDGNLEDFDKLMTGAAAGDNVEAKITISDDSANEELQGKEVTVEFDVLEVQRLQKPNLNAAFLEKIGGFEDEDDLRSAVREELERQLKYHQQQQLRQQITENLTKDTKFDLPPELVKRQADRELRRSVMELQSAGFDAATIQAHANTLRQNSQQATENALTEHFILERIAEDQNIEDQPQDYDDEIDLIADQSGESPRRVRARLEKQNQMDTLRNQIIERKTIELICKEANITETNFEPPQTGTTSAVNHAIAVVPEDIPEAKHGGDAEELQQPADRE